MEHAMTVNLNTGEQYEPRREDYSTKCAAAQPDGKGECPTWRAFLARVTNDDAELIAYLQRMCGYFLTGHTREHILFFLYGLGANGKSVFINTIAGIMGDYATTAPMETFTESRFDRHPTELAMLRGYRLVTASETQAGRRWNESRIKALTGGDKITARFMRCDFFEYTPQFKLLIAGNHRPSLRNVDEAIRRRIHLVPFTVTIPETKRDPLLAEKLKAEWDGILQWMVDGCLAWREHGLKPPQMVLDATDQYLASEDAVAMWIDECCTTDVNDYATSATLFASWKEWAEKAGEPIGSRKAFSQGLLDRGFKPNRRNTGTGFQGLAVRPKETLL
jgi:putative DNA primase/helicase